jgi:hypothetical protein
MVGDRIQPLVVGMPVDDVGIVPLAPGLDPLVHDPLPQRGHHRSHRHQRIAIGQLRRLPLGIGLQHRKAAVRLVVMVRMALQVDQQPVRRAVFRVPAVAGQNVFIPPVPQVAPGQPVMLDVVHQLQLPDRREGLDQEKGKPAPPAQHNGKHQEPTLQRRIAPEGVRPVVPGQVLPLQHRHLGLPGGRRALAQDAGEKAVEPFVVARRHRVARGADMEVMDPQMLGPEMRVEDRGQQKIGQPALQLRLLVHQLVAVVDPDGPGDTPIPKNSAMRSPLSR